MADNEMEILKFMASQSTTPWTSSLNPNLIDPSARLAHQSHEGDLRCLIHFYNLDM